MLFARRPILPASAGCSVIDAWLSVHGDLAAENVLVDGDRVSGVLGWGQTRVADPADDLAWLVATASPDAVESVLEAYAHTRRDAPDRDLLRRARLSGELAVARWLLHGTTTGDEEVVADADAMLAELEDGTDTGISTATDTRG